VRKPIVLSAIALLSAWWAPSATYYVDCAASGDGGAGTSTSTAWKTVGRINGGSFSPGDSILFKRGCTWRETLWPPSSGTSGHPIIFGAYGTGANPVISGADLITNWTLDSGNVYWASRATDPGIVFINNTVGNKKTSRGALTAQFSWFWDSGASRLYLYAPGDPDAYYTSPGVEYRVRNQCIGLGRDYLVFDGLTAEKSLYANFSGNPGNYGIIRNCITQYGDNGISMGGMQAPLYTGWEIHDNVCRYNAVMGISILCRGTHIKVYRNECYENDTVITDTGGGWTGGIKIWDSTNTMDNIDIYENYCYTNGRRWDRGVGIWVDEVQPPSGSILIHHNYLGDNPDVGILIEISSHSRVWENVIWNCGTSTPLGQAWNSAGISISSRLNYAGSNNLIYNNTIYGSQVGINVWLDNYQLTTARLDNNLVKNNIVFGYTLRALSAGRGGDNVTYGSGNVYEYNCFGPESSNFIEWGGSYKSTYGAWEAAYGGSTHSVQADPQLTNGTGGDLTLRATSPCIDAGADVGPSYGTALLPGSSWPGNVLTGNQSMSGTGWEIGAYVFPAAAPPPGSPTPTPTPGGPPTPTPTPGGPPTSTPTPTRTRTPTAPPSTFGASFTFSPSLPTNGQQVQFSDSSIGASAWSWDFGDGTQSSLRDPAHSYATRGVYTVALWVSNGVNWSKAEKTVTVTGSGRVRRNLAVENGLPRRTPGE